MHATAFLVQAILVREFETLSASSCRTAAPQFVRLGARVRVRAGLPRDAGRRCWTITVVWLHLLTLVVVKLHLPWYKIMPGSNVHEFEMH